MSTAIGAYATLAALKTRLGITTSADDALMTTICDQVNAYVEGPSACDRVIAPIASAVFLFDGDGTRVLSYPRGIRSVTLLEIAQFTGDAYRTVVSTDYRIRPSASMRQSGAPGTRIEWIDVPTSGFGYFPPGYDTVRVTMSTGWDAIPDDVTDVALTAASRAWYSRQAGQADIVGTDDMGRPLISRFFSSRDMGTLRAYSASLP